MRKTVFCLKVAVHSPVIASRLPRDAAIRFTKSVADLTKRQNDVLLNNVGKLAEKHNVLINTIT